MNNLSIRQVLGLLFLVPLVCVGVSLWQIAPPALDKISEAQRLGSAITLSQATGTLVHTLQIERGATSALLSGPAGDREASDRLAQARKTADAALAALEKTISDAKSEKRLSVRLAEYLDTFANRIREHKDLRDKVNSAGLSATQAIAFYTGYISELIDAGTSNTDARSIESISALRAGLRNLILAKESAGIQRASGAALTQGKAYDPVVAERFTGVTAVQHAALRAYFADTGPSGKTLFDQVIAAGVTQSHRDAEKAFSEAIRSDKVAQMTTGEWWKIATDRINAMHELEKKLGNLLSAAAAEESRSASSQLWSMVGIEGLLIALGLGMTAWIGQMLASPIRRAATALERSAAGDTTVEAPARINGSGEIACISNAVGAFIAANVERARLIAEREQAEKDMVHTRARVLNQMETEFNAASGQATGVLKEAAQTLNAKSSAMLSTVGAVRQAQDECYAAAEESRSTVSEVTRLSEELAQSISEIAQQSTRTAELASEVQTRAMASREAATQFEDVAQAIGSIVDLINAIAGQTNLLALNATIEAARAGDMGKGFAVVAGEVKDLAARTMDATRTIEGKVTELKDIARRAAEQATGLSDDVGNIQGLNSAIAAAVHEQHMTSEGFTGSIQSLATTINAMVEQVDSIARLGSEAHASAAAVQDVASEMDQTTSTLAETLPRLIAETSKRIAS